MTLSIPWQTNQTGQIVWMGPQSAALFGSPWRPEHGGTFNEWIDRREIDRFLQAWQTVCHRGMPGLLGCHWTHPDGSRWHLTTAVTPRIEHRAVVGLVGVSDHRLIG